MRLLDRVRGRFRELHDTSPATLGRAGRTYRYLYDLVRHCGRELKRDRAGQLAAALTYHSLFSLLPSLALALVVLQVFVGPEDQERFKSTVIDWVLTPLQARAADEEPLPDGLTPEGTGREMAVPEGTGAAAVAGGLAGEPESRARFAEAQEALSERVEQLFDELQGIDFGSIGIIGLLLFFYAATGLLTTIEQAFDRVFAARRRRPLHRRIPLYYTVITLGPIVLLAGLYLRGQLLDVLASGQWTRWLAAVLGYLSPLLTAWLALFLMFMAIPNTRVTLRAGAAGALVSALGVGVTAEAFRVYVSGAGLASLYGALAMLPLFLFWLYLLWLVVLFGLEVSYALQTVRGHDWVEAELQASRPVDDAWALPVAVRVAQAFEMGGVARADELAHQLDLPAVAVRKLIDRLEDSGFVRELDQNGQRVFTLTRPAHRIAMRELLEAARPLPKVATNGASSDALGTFLAEVHEAGLERTGERTLADFIGEAPPGTSVEAVGRSRDPDEQTPDP